ncbi:MAG: hypothetical protein ACXWFC_11000, partial [Nitrososphaeraceae archaeon]
NISQPIVDQNSSTTSNDSSIFTNPTGTMFLVVGVGGAEPYRITEKPYYIANQYNERFGFVDLKINDKRLDGALYDIGLNCKMAITEKTKKEVIDLESCLPSSSTSNNSNNNLKIIDRFTIIK